jgi:hypothetical protein
VTAKAEQANEHDNEQEDSGNKSDDSWHFGNMDVKWHAGGARSFPWIRIADLSKRLGRKTNISKIVHSPERYLIPSQIGTVPLTV